MEQLKIGSGLNNLGNTCFFNAVLQSVLHTKKLALLFANKNHSKNCQKSDWCVFCEMERTYHATRNNRVYSPSNLVNNLKKIFKKFKLGRQEDSHEFLRYLIQGMQDAETGKLGKERQRNESIIKKTKVFNVFGGIIKNVVLCLSCKHKSITKQRYYDLNIECQKSNTLDEGLQKFFAVDELKGPNKYLCQSCKNRVDATKRFYLESAPETLTFQLKRFTNMLRKIGKFIKYPKFIHLDKYFDHERKTVARLSAVIVHAGSCASSGHYYAYVRVGQNWFKMDDSYVTKCTEEQAMCQNAYVLFYEKVKDEKLQKQTNEDIKTKQAVRQTKTKENPNKINENPDHKLPNRQSLICDHKKKDDEKTNQNSNDTLKELKIHNDITLETEFAKNTSTETVNSNNQSNHLKRSSPVKSHSDDEDLPLPGQLQRKRSKLQAEQNMTLQEVILKAATNLRNLQSKLPPAHSPGHRSLRTIYNLRKFEISMKRRKFIHQFQ